MTFIVWSFQNRIQTFRIAGGVNLLVFYLLFSLHRHLHIAFKINKLCRIFLLQNCASVLLNSMYCAKHIDEMAEQSNDESMCMMKHE